MNTLRALLRTLSALLRSRKVLTALFGVIQTITLHYLNVDPEVWASIDVLIVTLIGAIALEDAAAKRSGNGGDANGGDAR